MVTQLLGNNLGYKGNTPGYCISVKYRCQLRRNTVDLHRNLRQKWPFLALKNDPSKNRVTDRYIFASDPVLLDMSDYCMHL